LAKRAISKPEVNNENQFHIGMMCRPLWVSRSGYYAWEQRPPSGRDQANQLLKAEIKRVFDDEKADLAHLGLPVGPKAKASRQAVIE
jgi:hypothetical protein